MPAASVDVVVVETRGRQIVFNGVEGPLDAMT